MMKHNHLLKAGLALTYAAAVLSGCNKPADYEASNVIICETTAEQTTENAEPVSPVLYPGGTKIALSDTEITVNGRAISDDTEQAVYVANDIVYYPEGQDFTYGEGTEADAHTQEDADRHTVIHITRPGTYLVSGQLSAGQIAVDLGEDAKDDPDAVVTLVLNGVDINCSVAPGVIFYNVYECCEADEDSATREIDTSAAGANVILADDSVNTVTGSYVARIYKSVELNEEGTEVIDSKKLHKYDGAFYSKMSMNIDGEKEGTGMLQIVAENEGLDSELHLTLNGGNIDIVSGNDGINTNEDNVSVTTINGGSLTIRVDDTTGEGDGIDSNGWLVINGGTVIAEACSESMDSGIDSDMGIHLNGGTVIATGNMLDRISDSDQNYVVFRVNPEDVGDGALTVRNELGDVLLTHTPKNSFSGMVVSSEDLTEGTYTLWNGDTQLASGETNAEGSRMDRPGRVSGGHRPPDGMKPPEDGRFPEGFEPPEDGQFPEGMEPPEDGQFPEGMEPPEGGRFPEGFEPPEDGWLPEGMEPPEDERFPEGMEPLEDKSSDA